MNDEHVKAVAFALDSVVSGATSLTATQPTMSRKLAVTFIKALHTEGYDVVAMSEPSGGSSASKPMPSYVSREEFDKLATDIGKLEEFNEAHGKQICKQAEEINDLKREMDELEESEEKITMNIAARVERLETRYHEFANKMLAFQRRAESVFEALKAVVE